MNEDHLIAPEDLETAASGMIPYDEEEYKILSEKILEYQSGNSAISLSSSEIERLAFTASDISVYRSYEDEDLEDAEKELLVVFACYQALPESGFVTEMLLEALMAFIEENGLQGEFDKAEQYLSRLAALQYAAPDDTALALGYANSLVLLFDTYIDSEDDDPEYKIARSKEAELISLVERYPTHPAIQAMSAWMYRIWVKEFIYKENIENALVEYYKLRKYLEKYPQNSLIACEYARTSDYLFDYYCNMEAYDEAEEYYNELYHLTHKYAAIHHSLSSDTPEYDFPNFRPDAFEDIFTDAFSEIAARRTEESDLNALLKKQDELNSFSDNPDIKSEISQSKGQIFSNICSVYLRNADFASAEKILEQLFSFSGQFPENMNIRVSLSHALYNTASYYAESNLKDKFPQAEKKITALKLLTNTYPDEPELRKMYASSLFNFYVEQEKSDLTRQKEITYETLYRFLLDSQGSPEIAQYLAEEEIILINKYGKANEFVKAKQYWQHLQKIAGKYADDKKINEQFSIACSNLIIYYSDNMETSKPKGGFLSFFKGKSDPFERIEEVYVVLYQLFDSKSDDASIALRLAKAAYTMVTDYGSADRFIDAEKKIKDLRSLSKAFPGDSEVVVRFVNASYNLGIDYKRQKKHARVKELYLEAAKAAAPFAGNEDSVMHENLAKFKKIVL